MKTTELFVIVALILPVVARFINPFRLEHFDRRGTGYELPPSFVCIALATMMCFFASL